MRVKCLAREHNTMSPARAGTRAAQSRDERANHEATSPPQQNDLTFRYINCSAYCVIVRGKVVLKRTVVGD